MPWQNNDGGPWGGGGGNGSGPRSPWGGGSGGGGPDMEDLVRQGQEKLRRFIPGGGNSKLIGIILAAVAVVWLATGFYTVQANEQGVELVFGKLWDTTNEGLHYNFPAPIGEVLKPKVTVVNKVEIGFIGEGASKRIITEESLMLTGDENIIDYQFVVFWVIRDAGKYLFNVRNPDQTVKNAAESAMREIIGQTTFEFARTDGRASVEVNARDLIQKVLDEYDAGILIQRVRLQSVDPPRAVIDAFRDVQAARADKERSINEATAYLNEVTNRARGEAEQILRAAEAYKEEQINNAKGESQRFLSIYEQYLNAKDVTVRRIYLQTMEKILGDMNKVLIDAGPGGGSGVLPYLPLDGLTKGMKPASNAGETQ